MAKHVLNRDYPDLKSAPQTHEQARAMGLEVADSEEADMTAPGAIFLNPTEEGFLRKECELCYMGPCERDSRNRLTGRRKIGHWTYYEPITDPQELIDKNRDEKGRVVREEDVRSDFTRWGWVCEKYWWRDPHCS